MCSEEAIEKHGNENVKVYTANFLPMYYEMVTHRIRMKMKLVTVGPTEKVWPPCVLLVVITCDPLLGCRAPHDRTRSRRDIARIWCCH